jgi:hypothetical protein
MMIVIMDLATLRKDLAMTDTHLTAPTRFIEVDGDRFAYRRWGNPSGVPSSSSSISEGEWTIGIPS